MRSKAFSRSRQYSRAHVLDDVSGEFAGLDFGGAWHQAFEVVGDFLLLDGPFQALFDEICGFVPAQMAEHHDPRQNHRARIDHIFIRVFRRGAVGGFEDGVAVADVRPRRDAESSHLRGAGVGDVVAIQIGACQHRVFIGPGYDLLKDRVGNAVIDHDFLLPRAVAMPGINAVKHFLHLFFDSLAKAGRGELHAGLNRVRILGYRPTRILVFVVDNPALAFGHDSVAKFLGGHLVSPLAERAFGKLLNVAFVDQSDGFAARLQSVLDRHAYQALRSGHRDRLDPNAGIEADLFLAAFQHVFIEELDQLGALRSSLLPLNPGIDVFGIFAKDDDVHALGMFHRRGHAFVILHGTHAAVEIENLPQGNVE